MFPRKEGKETIYPPNYILRELELDDRLQEADVAQKELTVRKAQSKIELQTRLTYLLAIAFSSALLLTIAVILLQGFAAWGFHLDQTTVNLLAAATIGEIAGLLTILISNLGKERKIE